MSRCVLSRWGKNQPQPECMILPETLGRPHTPPPPLPRDHFAVGLYRTRPQWVYVRRYRRTPGCLGSHRTDTKRAVPKLTRTKRLSPLLGEKITKKASAEAYYHTGRGGRAPNVPALKNWPPPPIHSGALGGHFFLRPLARGRRFFSPRTHYPLSSFYHPHPFRLSQSWTRRETSLFLLAPP